MDKSKRRPVSNHFASVRIDDLIKYPGSWVSGRNAGWVYCSHYFLDETTPVCGRMKTFIKADRSDSFCKHCLNWGNRYRLSLFTDLYWIRYGKKIRIKFKDIVLRMDDGWFF